jgi:hypothetical protein
MTTTTERGVVTLQPRDVFRAAGYRPHAGQVAVHASGARNRVVSAGRRFGKSQIGGHELGIEALATKAYLTELEERGIRREFWIVGPNYSDSEKEFRVHYNALKRMGAPFDKPGTYNNPHGGDMRISMYGGLYMVEAKSAQHPESLVGEGLSGVVMAEAAKQKESTWSKFIRPTLADFKGWSIFSSTPEGRNWFYELWNDGQDPSNPDWESWRLPSWVNPHVYPQGASDAKVATLRAALEEGGFDWRELVKRLKIDPEIASLVRDLNDASFNQEIGADFNEFAGRVFADWDEEVHVGDFQYNPQWETYAASDYGFTNPFVWLVIQVDPFGNVYIIDEFYERGLTIDEIAWELKARPSLTPENMKVFYPDPASPGDTKALERHLKLRAGSGTGGELDLRLRWIRAGLKVRNKHLPWGHPDRKPMLRVDRKCVNVKREFGVYKYPEKRKQVQETNEGEKPLKKDDHTPEALGRFYAGHYGAPEEGREGNAARVRSARMGR